MADDAPPLLPELARSLRTLGRPSDAATDAAHAAIFAPLLDARARAGRGDAGEALAAMRGAALAARIETLVRAAAAEGEADPAHARARVANARELLEPLRDALAELDVVARRVSAVAGTNADEWREWIAQLRRVFAAADVACQALARLLAERSSSPAPGGRGWFGRGRGGGG